MKRIYVSYRREDTNESYDRIIVRLREYFGSEATLRSDSAYTADGATVSASEYRTYVAGAMKRCAALLLLIGPRWLESGQPGGWSLSDLDDPVRIEIEAALRAGVPIVPALVQQGRMPRADELPASLRLVLEQDQERAGKRGPESLLSLVSGSGLHVRRDPDFGGDAMRLCEVIENLAGLEAVSLERAQGAASRMLRNVTLVASAALIAHAAILGYFALQVVVPLTPALVIPTGWLPTIIITSLIDWGVYFLAGYAVARRTGEVGPGVSAAVTAYVVGMIAEMIFFADITWSKWVSLSAPIATPGILVGAPDWLLGPALLLMHPFILLFAMLALGIPLGLIASFALGSLGGSLGVRVTEFMTTRQRERERKARIQSEAEAERGLGAALRRRRATSGPALRRGAMPAGKVFISYRRDDSAVMCGSIYDRLTEIFGLDTIFKDVDMIPVGVNFEKFISSTLEQCVAQVVVIGPRWVSIATAQGVRRLDDPTDFVRLEVESALRSGIKVIPVLVQGATMPTAEELPESMRPLADLQPVTVRYAPKFDGDMRDLGLTLAPTIWPESARKGFFKGAFSLRAGPRATQTAAFFWLALFLAYGVILGVEVVHSDLMLSGVRIAPAVLTFLGTAPVIITLLAVLSGAHFGYTTGSARQSFWLAWRAVLFGCAALALTTQILGATLFQSAYLATLDPFYREFATGALVAATVIALGPALIAALLGAAISAFFRRKRRLSDVLTLAPTSLQILYRADDATAGVRVTQGLAAFFGRRVLPPKWLRLQDGDLTLQPLTQRFASFYRVKILPLMRLRSLDSETGDGASALARDNLTRALNRSAAVLALVGPEWAATQEPESGMSDPENPLRVRIETALALGRPVIPVLLTGATMPSPDQLPASMREFAMLNAAWVRDAPDYPGDMRRLTRVIEQLSDLREARRASATWIPFLLGALLSALALVGADALVGRLVVSDYISLGQMTLVIAGGALVIVDLLIYGVTSVLVTRWSGRSPIAALAALLGASLAMLADAEWLRFAQQALDAGSAFSGITSLNAQTLDAIALFLVIRLPFQTLGALAASALGSFYGRIAYRRRERHRQERRLYEMARAATQSGPQAEMSARSARASNGAATRPIAPEAAALAASVVSVEPEASESAGPAGEAAGETGAEASAPPVEVAPPNSEDSRRETLLSEMRAAHHRMRTRARIRLGVTGGLVVAVLLIVSITAGQIYQSQVSVVNAENTAVASSAAAAAAATATWATSPGAAYSAVEPGPDCQSSAPGGSWTIPTNDPSSPYYDTAIYPVGTACNGTYTDLYDAFMSTPYPTFMMLKLNHPYAIAYELQLDVYFLDPGTCIGLISNGQSGSHSGDIEYQLCSDGAWFIAYVYRVGVRSTQLASGHVKLRVTDHLDVQVFPNKQQFTINGHVVKTLISEQYTKGTDYMGISLTSNGPMFGEIGAEISNFSYTPIAS